jgi:hypothetical protein
MDFDQRRSTSRWVGGTAWLSLVILCVGLLVSVASRSAASGTAGNLLNYWLGRELTIHRLVKDQDLVMPGDPIFHLGPQSTWTQVGFVESVSIANDANNKTPPQADRGSEQMVVGIRWHGSHLDPEQFRLVAHRNDGTLNETLRLLFPPEKRAILQQEISRAMRQNGEQLAEQFLPLVEQSLRQSIPVIESELVISLQRHREDLNEINTRWKEQWLDSRMVPLAKDQILPIAQEHAEPVVREIGRELWKRASLWSFTWRAVYDKTPLPRKDLMREEWERFVRDEAIPVIQSHSEEIVVVIERTLVDIAKNPKIRGEVGSAINSLADDPQTRKLIGSLLRETLIENPEIQRVWLDVWTSKEAKLAIDRAGDWVEPLVRKLGDEIIGSPGRGIDPGFARVLRHQILGKDRRWIIAEPIVDPTEDGHTIATGQGDAHYPLLPKMEKAASE